ncbi:MAG: DUF3048 domain-containing protein [Acidimicrobiia bacterium]|nr:DUF3048 domain-containing protein [Acidimicrobiia bacterium]
MILHRLGPRWLTPVIVALATVAAACGGGDTSADTTAPAPASPSTTAAPTTTAAPSTTTTTVYQGPVAPLTGLPPAGDVDLARPALVLKIDNHLDARPQTGIDLADIVFDIRAEGVTRFFAVFHSQTPNPAGPVRSSRTSDFDLLRGFDYPLYGSSGGNDYVMQAVRALPVQAVTNFSRNEYYRDSSRPAPHNLMIDANKLWALANDKVQTPTPWFAYRLPAEALPAGSVPAVGPVTIRFTGSPVVGYTWDETAQGWKRTQDGTPHTVTAGGQLAPTNVVVMETTYKTSPADTKSPEVVSVGSGKAVVLTAGHIITGSWSRPSATDKLTLVDDSGAPIALTPGRTWIEMPQAGQTTW